jgi:pimeloyl-ACP methyl ester carboxylesterase
LEVDVVSASAKTTIVLVHGAWADGSSWKAVIDRLKQDGSSVIAAPIPLTTLSDDVAALDRALERTQGPVVLAAHAYAGAVIAATRNGRVKGLVFIAALVPDEGETVADVFYRGKQHPQAPQLAPDGAGYIWMPASGFSSAFAQNASKDDNELFAAVQRPINVACIQEKAPHPLWKTVPSWYLLAEQDYMIDPNTQEFMAQRMKAKLKRLNVDHTPIATAPDSVVELIREAAESISPK